MKNKRLIRYSIILILCFILDNVISYYIPYNFAKTSIVVIPCISISMFTLLNNTIDETNRYGFALIMGMIYTVVYGNSLAIYIFLYLLFAFIGKIYMKKGVFNFFEALLMVVVNLSLKEFIIYGFKFFMHETNQPLLLFLQYRFLPTLVFNLVIFGLVYYIYNIFKIEIKEVDFVDRNILR